MIFLLCKRICFERFSNLVSFIIIIHSVAIIVIDPYVIIKCKPLAQIIRDDKFLVNRIFRVIRHIDNQCIIYGLSDRIGIVFYRFFNIRLL